MTKYDKGGPWYSTPRVQRKRKQLNVTLSEEAHLALERLADLEGTSRSAVLEKLVLRETVRRDGIRKADRPSAGNSQIK